MIWKRLPKTVISVKVTMNIGVCGAVLAYNKGAVSKLIVLKALDLKCSDSVKCRLHRIDLKRIAEAEKRMQEDKRTKRRVQTQIKKKKEKHKDYEGGMM